MAKRKNESNETGPKKVEESMSARFVGLISSGDYRSARVLARSILTDPAVSKDDRSAAEDALLRTSLEPGAVYVGILAVLVIATIALLLYR